MGDAIKQIVKIRNSKSYVDFANYHKNNLIAIGRKCRDETFHTNFIKWLLETDLCVGEPFFQVYKFVEMLCHLKDRKVNTNSSLCASSGLDDFLLGDVSITGINVESERIIHGGRLDILLLIKTEKQGTWPIIIENKVYSRENGKKSDQTQAYYNWAEKEYVGKPGYNKPIYLYLVPSFNSCKPKQTAFAIATYQDLVDCVIEPIINRCTDAVANYNLTMYLQCLSYQEDDKKGSEIMAISKKEREIIQSFIDENANLIELIIEVADIEEEEKTALRKATSSVKDKTKYDFDGHQNLSKRGMVFEVVSKYNDIKKPNWSELCKAFPDGLDKSCPRRKNHTIVIKSADITSRNDRDYDDTKLTTKDHVEFQVNNQWSFDDTEAFVKYVNNKFGSEIGEVVPSGK